VKWQNKASPPMWIHATARELLQRAWVSDLLRALELDRPRFAARRVGRPSERNVMVPLQDVAVSGFGDEDAVAVRGGLYLLPSSPFTAAFRGECDENGSLSDFGLLLAIFFDVNVFDAGFPRFRNRSDKFYWERFSLALRNSPIAPESISRLERIVGKMSWKVFDVRAWQRGQSEPPF